MRKVGGLRFTPQMSISMGMTFPILYIISSSTNVYSTRKTENTKFVYLFASSNFEPGVILTFGRRELVAQKEMNDVKKSTLTCKNITEKFSHKRKCPQPIEIADPGILTYPHPIRNS